MVSGECIGEYLHAETSVPSKEDCLHICQSFEDCKWFTFAESISTCLLMADCEDLDATCTDCVSGESRCQDEEEGNDFGALYLFDSKNLKILH